MTLPGGLRDRLAMLYSRHSVAVNLAVRFLFALTVFFFVREKIPFSPLLSGPVLLVLCAAVLSFLPARWISFAGCLLVIGQAFALDLVAGAVTLCVILMLFLLFVRFVPEEAPAAALTPLMSLNGFGAVLPVMCGLTRSPASLLAVLPGAVISSLMEMLFRDGELLRGMEKADYTGKLAVTIGGLFDDRLAVRIISMAACLILVYAVRSLSVRYAPQLAALLGGAVYVVVIIFGQALTGAAISLPAELTGAAGSVAAALLILPVLYPLRWRKSEYLRFEDDDYYYYVKAVPKAHGRHYAGESGGFGTSMPDPDDTPITKPDIDDAELARKLENSLDDLETDILRDL